MSEALSRAVQGKPCPLPAIPEQYGTIEYMFPYDRLEDPGAFNHQCCELIALFPAMEDSVFSRNLMDKVEKLKLFERDDLQARMNVNCLIMIAAARLLLEDLNLETPAPLHFGRTIYEQLIENLGQVGLTEQKARELIPESDLCEAWRALKEEHGIPEMSLADAELVKDKIQQILHIDSPGNATKGADGEAYVLCH